ncbi:HD domain-containing protein [Salidesulfovibrio onnuriiensis]|uniref:HD domain-containing protein n=1 Tax=Salidesulfovibrio onnuriiensis TaxID=2583823 RepID=UPI0011C7DE57|nr:HD domain-containing protein [Salidesulfovibrio onnuriiensis]
MHALLEAHKKQFLGFAESHYGESEKDDYNIRLKIEHTFRVLAIAESLCESAPLSQEQEQAALLAALYHDLGRFPQYRRFKTFNDRLSANHAVLGIKTLNKTQFIAGLAPDVRRMVYGAVRMHNMKGLPSSTPPSLKTVCNIVRDSDKLDIIPVMLAHLCDENPNNVVVMDAEYHATNYTPAILEELRLGQVGDYRKLKWTNDFKLLVSSWVFDLNFPKSYSILDSKGYIGQIFNTLPDNETFRELRRQLELHVENRII